MWEVPFFHKKLLHDTKVTDENDFSKLVLLSLLKNCLHACQQHVLVTAGNAGECLFECLHTDNAIYNNAHSSSFEVEFFDNYMESVLSQRMHI